MSRKIYDPFEKMSKEQLDDMIEIDVTSRNLKDIENLPTKKNKSAGNFLHLQESKKAS